MKSTYFFALTLLLVACGAPASDSETSEMNSTVSSEAIETIIDAPTVDASIEQLSGIWIVSEIRTNPDFKGTKPDMLNEGVVFGFTADGRMSTTSMGAKYMRETLEESPFKYKIENGVIQSLDDNGIFKMQWGEEGIRVVKIGSDELCIWHNILGKEKDKYAYLTRVQ